MISFHPFPRTPRNARSASTAAAAASLGGRRSLRRAPASRSPVPASTLTRVGGRRLQLPALRRRGPRRDASLRAQMRSSAVLGPSRGAAATRPSFVAARGSRMLAERLGWEMLVHNGKVHRPLVVESKRMGRRFGDYVPTKQSSGKR